MPIPLTVKVNEDFVLDAGTYEDFAGSNGMELLLRPPKTTMYHQVLAYLREKPDPRDQSSSGAADYEGVAAAAATLRWGSYLAVLLDREKRLWSAVKSPNTSRISDEEMARINIEASAALAEWVELYRTDRSQRLYFKLVNRAVAYLPMAKRKLKLKPTEFVALAQPEFATEILKLSAAECVQRLRADARRFASRIFANALTNHAWRNGPVEAIHGGGFQGYPLDQRRMSTTEERDLMTFASERLALGMMVCGRFRHERPTRPWPDQVLPYGLAGMLLITPSQWSLTESSREVRLPVAN